MSLTVSAIDWLLLLFWHKKEKSDPKLNNPQAFKEGKQRPRSQLHASQTKQKKFQNDATTHKGWQGSKQAIGSSSSSSPRTTTIHMLQANHGNQLTTTKRELENGNFVTRAKALIHTHQILMIAQHLEHLLDSGMSHSIITLHSRARPGAANPCRTSFRLRKTR
jgi:hypothetical protein